MENKITLSINLIVESENCGLDNGCTCLKEKLKIEVNYKKGDKPTTIWKKVFKSLWEKIPHDFILSNDSEKEYILYTYHEYDFQKPVSERINNIFWNAFVRESVRAKCYRQISAGL